MTADTPVIVRIGRLIPRPIRPVARVAYLAARLAAIWLLERALKIAGWWAQFVGWINVWLSEPPARWADRRALGILVRRATGRAACDIAYIGEISDLAPVPPSNACVFHLADANGGGSRQNLNLRLPANPDRRRALGLVIYATAGFLAGWDRLEADLDCFLAAYRTVAIVLIADKLQPLTVAGHSYMLSILLSGIPSRKFEFGLDVYIAGLVPPRKTFVAEFCRFYLHSVIDCIRWRFSRRADPSSPDRFSALVISVTPRVRPT